MTTTLACNLRMFPHHIRNIFHSYGHGMSAARGLYRKHVICRPVNKAPDQLIFAYMFGGLVRKMGCRIRPYEKGKGENRQDDQKRALMSWQIPFSETGQRNLLLPK